MKRAAFLAILSAFILQTTPAQANHAAGYHWKRSSNPFTVRLIDSTTGSWDDAFQTAAGKWSRRSDVLNTKIVAGDTSLAARQNCSSATAVRTIHVCSAAYPYTWAGLTEVTEDSSGHIVKARIRLNSRVTKGLSLRTAVSCHELGHGWGLAHRDQSETTSCMTPVVSASQTHPDAHDIAELDTIYAHADGLSPAGTRTYRYVIE